MFSMVFILKKKERPSYGINVALIKSYGIHDRFALYFIFKHRCGLAFPVLNCDRFYPSKSRSVFS